MQIEEVTQVTDELVIAFARLIPQLAPSTPPPTWAELMEVVASPTTMLWVARDAKRDGAIVGTLTLVIFRIPTGWCAWIEDVVVDAAVRGQGIGEALCRAALERAAAAGVTAVDLTSRPARAAANRLYQRIGFQKRETNVYRYDLG